MTRHLAVGTPFISVSFSFVIFKTKFGLLLDFVNSVFSLTLGVLVMGDGGVQ